MDNIDAFIKQQKQSLAHEKAVLNQKFCVNNSSSESSPETIIKINNSYDVGNDKENTYNGPMDSDTNNVRAYDSDTNSVRAYGEIDAKKHDQIDDIACNRALSVNSNAPKVINPFRLYDEILQKNETVTAVTESSENPGRLQGLRSRSTKHTPRVSIITFTFST